MKHNKNVIREGFFLLIDAYDPPFIEYREIKYCRTKGKMVEYIQQEYSGTDAESVIACPFSGLLNGKVYKTGQRQGNALFDLRITLVHDTNLDKLYRFLDYAELMDEEGNPIDLSVHMIEAEDVYEIEEIVNIFNESQDNYW